MVADKYTAVWVSHSSMADFLACPRAYFLKNVYKDPKTGHKITLMSPPLALGQAVHEVIESLSVLPTEHRFKDSLIAKLETAWAKVTGKKGGFADAKTEQKYKAMGQTMLKRVMDNPGPLLNKAVKITMELPYFWLSEEDNIILCGKIDWLEYLPDTDSVHIIDFKTGKSDEDPQSLQLPIYLLLAGSTQSRPITKASYWYLERHDDLTHQHLPDPDRAKDQILKVAKKIKLARSLGIFKCPQGENGCFACRPLEAVIRGQAEFVGTDDIRRDVYIHTASHSGRDNSLVL